MPDKRRHRGPHPEDQRYFARRAQPDLRKAVANLSWLLTRGYAQRSALKLVGDRFNLAERQRLAVMRCACSDQSCDYRHAHELAANGLAGKPLLIDGYNVLTTIEAALSNGVIMLARDGCLRDMASMHGNYRKVTETEPALVMIGETLANLSATPCHWYLDQPVSNSGKLKTMMGLLAESHGWDWQIKLVHNPDSVLFASPHTVATADSLILDRCDRWFNLARCTLNAHLPNCPIVRLSD